MSKIAAQLWQFEELDHPEDDEDIGWDDKDQDKEKEPQSKKKKTAETPSVGSYVDDEAQHSSSDEDEEEEKEEEKTPEKKAPKSPESEPQKRAGRGRARPPGKATPQTMSTRAQGRKAPDKVDSAPAASDPGKAAKKRKKPNSEEDANPKVPKIARK